MQPQIATLLALSEGTSIVTESIFENRFKYVDELSRMGATITVEGNTAIINGTEKFNGAIVSAPDLRAGAALVIAGLAAEEGYTFVDQIEYIERGYEAFEEKLSALGATIEKVNIEATPCLLLSIFLIHSPLLSLPHPHTYPTLPSSLRPP